MQRKRLKEKINAAEEQSNYDEKEELEEKLSIFNKFGTLTKHEQSCYNQEILDDADWVTDNECCGFNEETDQKYEGLKSTQNIDTGQNTASNKKQLQPIYLPGDDEDNENSDKSQDSIKNEAKAAKDWQLKKSQFSKEPNSKELNEKEKNEKEKEKETKDELKPFDNSEDELDIIPQKSYQYGSIKYSLKSDLEKNKKKT